MPLGMTALDCAMKVANRIHRAAMEIVRSMRVMRSRKSRKVKTAVFEHPLLEA